MEENIRLKERVKKLEKELENLRGCYEDACSDVRDFSRRIRQLEEQRIWGKFLTVIAYLTAIVFLWSISISFILKYKKAICE